jgi:hypothetical protein
VRPDYKGGKHAQARYLRSSIPAIRRAGAAKVFVSERDNLGGCFASEGVLCGAVKDPPRADVRAKRKRAFYALRTMIAARSRAHTRTAP